MIEKGKKEKTWTYHCKIIFSSSWEIEWLTITEHYLKSGHDKHGITNELILELMNKLNEIPIMKPKKHYDNRNIYVWERIPHHGKKYLIVFWFKDDTNNHLWVRTCYPQRLKKKFWEEKLE
ncbi:MAG: hypothetical protein I3273_05435 [Candidatus Moeniiplasma glomeromycotorum]|nr:hypothetical protein [Candidatus Moeniiplasma glomeromycotorum]MCE8169532.1 hypothetical protein [Candidatus Moeniiplasma glomeromycotorum]